MTDYYEVTNTNGEYDLYVKSDHEVSYDKVGNLQVKSILTNKIVALYNATAWVRIRSIIQ